MSKECDYCGFRDPMPFTCRYCGNLYCYNHRLPESHNCAGLARLRESLHESGKIYYRPDMAVKKRRSPIFNSLNNAVSTIKSNYSLTILAIALISFFLQNTLGFYRYDTYLALYPPDIISRPWILVTHIFLHSGPIHLLFNMMFLYFFGQELERRIGGKRFLAVFFLSGITAALGYSLWSIVTFYLFRMQIGIAVGASGALFGIFACLAVLAPHLQVYVYFFPMKITHALIFFALLDLLFIGSGDAIARSAHLSGVIAGLIMGKQIKKRGKYIGY